MIIWKKLVPLVLNCVKPIVAAMMPYRTQKKNEMMSRMVSAHHGMPESPL